MIAVFKIIVISTLLGTSPRRDIAVSKEESRFFRAGRMSTQFVKVNSGVYQNGLLNVITGCYVKEAVDYKVVKKGKGLLGSLNDEVEPVPLGKLILIWMDTRDQKAQSFPLSEEDSLKYIQTMKAQAASLGAGG